MSVQCLYCKVVIELEGKTVHLLGCPAYDPRLKRPTIKYEVPDGDPGKPCNECGINIHLVETKKCEWRPVESDGTLHWENCPGWEGREHRREVRRTS